MIGKVIMTNPGSFGFHKHPDWQAFNTWSPTHTVNDTIESESYADPTLKCVIRVIREGYYKFDQKPTGIVEVYNLSSIVQPKGALAEDYHNRAKKIIEKNNMNINILKDPLLYNKEKFLKSCESVDFVIIGFLKGSFTEKQKLVKKWSEGLSNVVTATDKNGV